MNGIVTFKLQVIFPLKSYLNKTKLKEIPKDDIPPNAYIETELILKQPGFNEKDSVSVIDHICQFNSQSPAKF